MHRFWDIRLQKCCDLENRVMGPSRSLEMSPLDRAHMTSYWRSIVTMALSRVIFEIFNIEKWRDLEIGVRGHSRSLNVIPFGRSCMVYGFLLVFCSNFVPKTHRFWDIRLQKCCDLENRVMGPSRSLELSPFDTAHVTFYWRSTVATGLSRTSYRLRDKGWFQSKIAKFSYLRVFCAPAEWVPLRIGYRRKGSKN